jgi:sugar-specific transcriptional regulator TrmB
MALWGARTLGMSLAALVCVGAATADDISQLQARFDRESNSVRKAKLLEKLGDAQLEETRSASRASDYARLGLVLEKYRDNARAAVNALKKEHPDAERHTGGYKQLQIHIHKAIRDVDEILVIVPEEYRPPIDIVRRDLAALDDELLNSLFPRRPEGKKPEEKKNAAPPTAPPEM